MKTTETCFRVEGMDCGSCAGKIDAAVRRLPGVTEVSVAVGAGTMKVQHLENVDLPGQIERRVAGLGYTAAAVPHHAEGSRAGDQEGQKDVPEDAASWWRSKRGVSP